MADHADVITEAKNLIFVESVKSLLLINGGGAVALATWLQAVWGEHWAPNEMLWWQLFALVVFAVGVLCAAIAAWARFQAFYHPNTHTPLRNPYFKTHKWAAIGSMVAFSVAVFFIALLVLKLSPERVISIPGQAPIVPKR